MIDILSGSKIRKNIILLFLYNREKRFGLSEVAARVSTSAGTAQRELNRLLDADLLSYSKKSGRGLYFLNKQYLYLREIASIARKSAGAETEIKAALERIKGIKYAFIFGSYAKGGLRSGSDIDLFIVGRVDEKRVFEAVQKAEKAVGRQVNYHIAKEAEFFRKASEEYFYKDILKKYILLKGDKDGFRESFKGPGKGRQAQETGH